MSLTSIFGQHAENFDAALRDSAEFDLAKARQLLSEYPQDTDAYLRVVAIARRLERYEEAIAALKDGINACAPSRRLYLEYFFLLQYLNRAQQAIEVVQRARVHFPNEPLLQLKEFLALPMLYSTPSEVDFYRRRVESGLAAISSDLKLTTAEERKLALAAWSMHENFLLPYQGRNDLEFQIRFAELTHRVMAENFPHWVKPLPMPSAPSGGKLRIGYISASFFQHSVSKLYLGWLQERDRDRFAVFSYYIGRQQDATTEEASRASDRFEHIHGDLEGVCEAVLNDRLHVAVFLDIGMKPAMAQLAALRLAPVQCVAMGHPVTTGLPTMNYFLSSDTMEPDDGEQHYSEKLVRLPGTGFCFRKPVIPEPLFYKTRADFGIRHDAVAYLSCQSSFKYLPQHDDVYPLIAKKVSGAQFIFLQWNEFIGADLRKRLDRAFAATGLDARDYCLLLRPLDIIRYWNLHYLCDVFLDTLDWSGEISSFEAVACKLPIVTLPGKFMRGRHAYGILNQLGVTETIAKDKVDYVAIAARLGLDPSWRKAIVERMIAGFPRLYSDTSCVRALEGFYEEVVRERLAAQTS